MRSGFQSRRQKKRLMAEINVVPYVDVTLVLLIIFMVTVPIAQQSVSVELPAAPQLNKQSVEITETQKPFVITVTKDGQYKTSENPSHLLSQKELATLVSEVMARKIMNPKTPIYIQGDKNAAYGKVVHLFVLLKSNGIDHVSLMTSPEGD